MNNSFEYSELYWMNIFFEWIFRITFWIEFWIEPFLGPIQWKNEFSKRIVQGYPAHGISDLKLYDRHIKSYIQPRNIYLKYTFLVFSFYRKSQMRTLPHLALKPSSMPCCRCRSSLTDTHSPTWKRLFAPRTWSPAKARADKGRSWSRWSSQTRSAAASQRLSKVLLRKVVLIKPGFAQLQVFLPSLRGETV